MNDEIRFKNVYEAEFWMMKEYAKYVFCRSGRILGMILMAVSAAAFGISLWMGYSLSESALFLLCFLGGLAIYCYYILVLKVMNRQITAGKNGKMPECIIDFTKDGIRMIQGSAKIQYDYQDIRKLYNLSGIYALTAGNGQAVLVKKGAFLKGNEEEFEQFITMNIKNSDSQK